MTKSKDKASQADSLPKRKNEKKKDARMAENQVVFRRYNESVQKGFDKLDRIAQEDGQSEYVKHSNSSLHFLCECSDENCRQRVLLRPSKYNEIHLKRNRFVIVCGHEVEHIEQVIEQNDKFCVVEKFTTPPKSSKILNVTDVDNS